VLWLGALGSSVLWLHSLGKMRSSLACPCGRLLAMLVVNYLRDLFLSSLRSLGSLVLWLHSPAPFSGSILWLHSQELTPLSPPPIYDRQIEEGES
jgi:hypothetical protein